MFEALRDDYPSRTVRHYRASTLISHSLAVERVIDAMGERLDMPLTLDEMAEIAYLSPFHFNRTFRSITGLPPGEFLAALRLGAAKRLLLTTSLSVTDICFDLGYASLGAFSTRFKQQVGVSPQQLRQMSATLADEMIQPLIAKHMDARLRGPGVAAGPRGVITAPHAFSGLIFIGLFPKPIPQGLPVACVTVTAPGAFQMRDAPDGRYYALAAALPPSPDRLAYLAPDAYGVLVAACSQPVTVRAGHARDPIHLALRRLDPTDPPILGIFPPLLASLMKERALQMRNL